MHLSVIGVLVELRFDGSVPQTLQDRIVRSWSRCIAPDDTLDAAEDAVVVGVALDDAYGLSAPARRAGTDAAGRPMTWITAQDGRELESQLTVTLTLKAIEVQRERLWLFHAAALSDSDGRTIALAAASGTGKTTFATHLGRRFAYVTDETAAVDPDTLAVIPYPKPLSTIVEANRVKAQIGPDELGLGIPGPALRLVRLAVLDRIPGTPRPRVEAMNLGDALLALVPQISYLRSRRRGLHALADLIRGLGGAVRIVYDNADDVAGILDRLFEEAREREAAAPMAAPGEPAEPDVGGRAAAVSPSVTSAAAPGAVAISGLLTRAPEVCDALRLGPDELFVLTGPRLLLLDGLGAVLWEALGRPATLDELFARVLDAMPEVPEGVDAHAEFEAALQSLQREGVITGAGALQAFI
jgi:hypothetical protein